MKKEHGILGLVGICIVILAFSFAGVISDFITRLIGNIDGLLLLMICLMMAGLFDAHPKFTLILGHLGEGLPFWLHRLDDHTHAEKRGDVGGVIRRRHFDHFETT